MSSILPDTIIEGTADMKPEMNRPITAEETDLGTPTMMHEMQYRSEADM
jgi:hypothetical protein